MPGKRRPQCYQRRCLPARPGGWLRRVGRYNAIAASGMVLSLTILTTLMYVGHVQYLVANLLAIGPVTLWNYTLNRRWTWSAARRAGGSAPGTLAVAAAADQGGGTIARDTSARVAHPTEEQTIEKQYHEYRAAVPYVGHRASRSVPGARADTTGGAALVGGLSIPAFLALLLGSFVLRFLFSGQQSVFMDESNYILIGRSLIEQHSVYAFALDWTYGSYLWPLLAGAADMVGGLRLVRALTACCGVAMVAATTYAALQLAPAALTAAQRRITALLAGAIMAIAPTAIAIGRFGTYDALAGAAFMSGVAVLLAARRSGRRWQLLLAAMLLFIGFLGKYIVAIYFPLICLYLLIEPLFRAPRAFRISARNLFWCVLPLGILCVAYFSAFRASLFTLLFEHPYNDLRSATPLNEYVWQRPEIWLIVAVAVFGWRQLAARERLITAGGVGVIAAAQAIGRPDHDWWKHSIYAIFFLAPLAGVALGPLAARIAAPAGRWRGRREPRFRLGIALAIGLLGPLLGAGSVLLARSAAGRIDLSTRLAALREHLPLIFLVLSLGGLILAPPIEMFLEARNRARSRATGPLLGILMALVVPLILGYPLVQARQMVTFYSNLNPAVGAIRANTVTANRLFIDDTAMNYYLYPRIADTRVTGPFWLDYRGQQGVAAYRRAITDRYFDMLVLDGGVSPITQEVRAGIDELIPLYYERIYPTTANADITAIYRAREAIDRPPAAGATVLSFGNGTGTWGARPDNTTIQPNLHVSIAQDRTLFGQPTMRFDSAQGTEIVGTSWEKSAKRVRMQVYIPAAEQGATEVRLGMLGFNSDWQWRDDGFQQTVPLGRWTELTWDLSEPGLYHELGLFVPANDAKTIYIGRVEIEP